jgi:hypothetical protein
VRQDPRSRAAKLVRRQTTVSKTVDRGSEKTLDLDIQIEKPTLKEAG